MKNIVFDMDGVLFATEALSDRIWAELTEELQVPHMKTVLQQCRGRNRTDTEAFFSTNYPEFPYRQFSEYKRTRMMAILDQEGMPIKTGAVELLTALKEENWHVALATSTSYDSTMHHLQLAKLLDFFDVILTGDQIKHGKPHPEIYLTACQKLFAVPSETYAIEDSENGVKSAYAAGMRVIMVPDQIQPTLELQALTVSIQPSLLEVRNMLLNR